LSLGEQGDGQDVTYPGVLATHGLGSPSSIAWRPALKAAILLAIPASLLSSIFSGISLFCVAAASVWAVNLYARRIRASSISTGAGARIGLVTGMLANWMILGLSGAHVWSSRFVFHRNAQMDADWTSFVDQSMQINQNFYSQIGVNSAQLMQELQVQRLSMLSADGRAGFPLFFFFVSALFLVVFSLIAGAISARFLTSSKAKRT